MRQTGGTYNLLEAVAVPGFDHRESGGVDFVNGGGEGGRKSLTV